jgi:hypothetical protein
VVGDSTLVALSYTYASFMCSMDNNQKEVHLVRYLPSRLFKNNPSGLKNQVGGRMKKRIVILGAGIVGRLAKIMFPEAVVLESKAPDDVFTTELGVCISIVPIPDLKNEQYTRYITVDNCKPTLELISRYKKKIARESDMSYGDYRQFEPEQIVYRQELPKNLDISFNTLVTEVGLHNKKIQTLKDSMEYDYLISTIPLLNFLQISDLFENFKESTSAFFMHRPIYLVRTKHTTKPGIIEENYITDLDTPMYRENFFEGWRNQESLFKIVGAVKIYPGKIYPCSYVPHILEDLSSYGIFCAGRYAQWDNKIHLWNAYSQLKFLRGIL